MLKERKEEYEKSEKKEVKCHLWKEGKCEGKFDKIMFEKPYFQSVGMYQCPVCKKTIDKEDIENGQGS